MTGAVPGDLAPQFVSSLLSPSVGLHDWQRDAACADKDPELFFRPCMYPVARAICAGCPVIDQCREWNDQAERLQGSFTDQGGLAGVFAGEDPRERVARRERGRENTRQRPSDVVVERPDRNEEIVRLFREGDLSLGEIAGMFGITPQRVWQIVKQDG